MGGRRQHDNRTRNQAIRYRINQEIEFLYKKKQHINRTYYDVHLECAQQFNGIKVGLLNMNVINVHGEKVKIKEKKKSEGYLYKIHRAAYKVPVIHVRF